MEHLFLDGFLVLCGIVFGIVGVYLWLAWLISRDAR